MLQETRLGVRQRVSRRLGVALALVLCAAVAEARPVTASWDPNPDGITVGYRLYYGTASGVYGVEVDVGSGTVVGSDITHPLQLVPGSTYYFVVRAYDSLDQLGPASDEATITLSNTAPVLANPGGQANMSGNVVSFQLLSTDPENDLQNFPSVTGLPPGLNANNSGLITGTVGTAGTYTVTATVSDSNLTDVEAFTWRVIAFGANPNPVASGGIVTGSATHAPGGVGDWIAMAAAGAPVGQYLDWRYLNGSTTRPDTGVFTAAVNFAAPLPGSYELRFFRDDSLALFSSAAFTVISPTTLTAVPAQVRPSSGVSASIGTSPGGPLDWVAMYQSGAAHAQYLDWRYLNGLQTPPGTGVTSATVSFTAPTTPGNYEFRVFSDGSVNLLAQATFSVSNSAPTVSFDLPTVAPATIISAAIANGPANNTDWVALAPTGSPLSGYVDWKYFNGLQTSPGSGSTIATIPFIAPDTPGTYELRFYANNTAVLLATSAPFTVSTSAPSLTAQPPLVGAGGGIQVSVTNGPGNDGDWVALYATGAGASEYLAYQYLNGLPTMPGAGVSSATLSFVTPITPGTYHFVLFLNNSTGILARTATFTVANSAPNIVPELTSVAPGAPVSFVVANGPGDPTDWLAMYVRGAPANEFFDWKYLNGSQTPTSGLTNSTVQFTMPLVVGPYELVFYSSNSYGLLARSIPINVSNSARSIVPASTVAGAGTSLNVTVANGPGNAADWVALYPLGAAPTGFVDWKYLNGQQAPPGTGVTGATVAFAMPITPGAYQFVFYANDGLETLALSVVVTVP